MYLALRTSATTQCDIFELEEEEVEIEISSVLPSAPDSACSISTTQSVKNRMKAVLIVRVPSAFYMCHC